jgi:hypothetical protein
MLRLRPCGLPPPEVRTNSRVWRQGQLTFDHRRHMRSWLHGSARFGGEDRGVSPPPRSEPGCACWPGRIRERPAAVVVAPITFNTVGKLACGIADTYAHSTRITRPPRAARRGHAAPSRPSTFRCGDQWHHADDGVGQGERALSRRSGRSRHVGFDRAGRSINGCSGTVTATSRRRRRARGRRQGRQPSGFRCPGWGGRPGAGTCPRSAPSKSAPAGYATPP